MHLISTPLPPNVNGEALGSLTLRFKSFQVENSSGAAIFCRVQFWGQEEFSDIERGCSRGASIEYPLTGNIEGIRRYFADMSILTLPIVKNAQQSSLDHVFLGQGVVPLIDLLHHLFVEGSEQSNNRTITVPLISMPNTAKESSVTYQCHQFGELELDVQITIYNETGSVPATNTCVNKEEEGSMRPSQERPAENVHRHDGTFSQNVETGSSLIESNHQDSMHQFILLRNETYRNQPNILNRTSIVRDWNLRDLHAGDETFSIMTEDDSILLDAMLNDERYLLGTHARPYRRYSPLKRKDQRRNRTLGGLAVSTLLKAQNSDLETNPYSSLPPKSYELCRRIEKIRFAKLDIKSLHLSKTLLQKISSLTSTSNCRFKVQCWLKFKAPPFFDLSSNQSNVTSILIFSSFSGGEKSENKRWRKLKSTDGQTTKGSALMHNFENLHKLSHSTVWNVNFQQKSHVASWLNDCFTFDLVAQIQRLDPEQIPRNKKSYSSISQKDAVSTLAKSRSDISLASADLQLESLFLQENLHLESKVPFQIKDDGQATYEGWIDTSLFLAPDQNQSNLSEGLKEHRSALGIFSEDNADCSMDLMDDTIISEVSRLTQSQQQMSKRVKDGVRKENSSLNLQKSHHSPYPLWMYFSLSNIQSLFAFHKKTAPIEKTPFRIKVLYNVDNDDFTRDRGHSSVYSERLINLEKSSETNHGHRNDDNNFVWVTMLNSAGAQKIAESCVVTVEIWTHTASTPAVSNLTKSKEDAIVDTIVIPFRIPNPLGLDAVIVKNDTIRIKGWQFNSEGRVQATVAIGLLNQVQKFEKRTNSVKLLQMWWRENSCKSGQTQRKSVCAPTTNKEASVDDRRLKLSHCAMESSTKETDWRNITTSKIWTLNYSKEGSHDRKEPFQTKPNRRIDTSTEKLNPSCQLKNGLKDKSNIVPYEDSVNQFCEGNRKHQCDGNRTDLTQSVKASNLKEDSSGTACIRSSLATKCTSRKVFIRFGECSGVREMISLWVDNNSSNDFRPPSIFKGQEWNSSGILVTFSIPAWHNSFRFSSTAQKMTHFSSSITRMENMNRHSTSLGYIFSIMVDDSEQMSTYMQSKNLLCKLWFIPIITETMLKHYPTSDTERVRVPQSAQLVCDTKCPLTVLANKCGAISYLCPWSLALAPDANELVGEVRISMGTEGTESQSISTIKLNPTRQDSHELESYPNIFDWDLPDKIGDAILKPKHRVVKKPESSQCEVPPSAAQAHTDPVPSVQKIFPSPRSQIGHTKISPQKIYIEAGSSSKEQSSSSKESNRVVRTVSKQKTDIGVRNELRSISSPHATVTANLDAKPFSRDNSVTKRPLKYMATTRNNKCYLTEENEIKEMAILVQSVNSPETKYQGEKLASIESQSKHTRKQIEFEPTESEFNEEVDLSESKMDYKGIDQGKHSSILCAEAESKVIEPFYDQKKEAIDSSHRISRKDSDSISFTCDLPPHTSLRNMIKEGNTISYYEDYSDSTSTNLSANMRRRSRRQRTRKERISFSPASSSSDEDVRQFRLRDSPFTPLKSVGVNNDDSSTDSSFSLIHRTRPLRVPQVGSSNIIRDLQHMSCSLELESDYTSDSTGSSNFR